MLSLYRFEWRNTASARTSRGMCVSSPLRTMIEDTLRNEFSSVDLSTILPDDYTRMDLEDLAYAVWLRSDLSKWRIPAVITINDIFDHPVSRFGVGLPQFSERRSEVGPE